MIEIRQAKDDAAHIFLWVPALKTVLGGVSVFTGSHPWLADSTDDSHGGDTRDACYMLERGDRSLLRALRGALCTAELLDEPGAELHPALGDRLAALQVGLHSLIDEAPSAAHCYFRKLLPVLQHRFDRAPSLLAA